MKRFRLIFFAGIPFEVAGFILLAFANADISGSDDLVLAPGEASFAQMTINMPGGGPVSGSFRVSSGHAVWIALMDEGQHELFLDGASTDSRWSDIRSTGSFSIEQVDMERCYIVVQHATLPDTQETVRVNYVWEGTDWTYMVSGMAMLMVGATSMSSALYIRFKDKTRAMASARKYIDVVIFDDDGRR